jgi:hypothetical protein
MVGTVHRDPKGFGRLLRLLEKEEPQGIAVEVSPYALTFRARQTFHLRSLLRENLRKIQADGGESYREILSHGEIQGIFLLLKVPYEWKAAEFFARRENAWLKAIDLSNYSEKKLQHLAELIGPNNLRALLRTPRKAIADRIAAEYARARNFWTHPPPGWAPSEETENREVNMAEEISRLTDKGRHGKVLFIGGWEHLLDPPSGETLYTRLRKYRPRRILLGDVS